VVGTITHTRGYCAAAVARADEVRSVGMDAALHRELNAGVRRRIGLPEEWDDCARLPGGVSWSPVLFSVKETIYKVWHPVVGTWLDFHDARVTLDPESGLFTARIAPARLDAAPVPDPPATVTGRFSVDADLVRTAAVLSPR
jgi:4'-phosphopantetheinyl transferase EntD